MIKRLGLALPLLLGMVQMPRAWAAPTKEEAVAILKLLDERLTHAAADYQAKFFIEEKAPGKDDVVRSGVVYRRDSSDQIILLFVAPHMESGKGYLRITRNLWFYDPRTGKWDRRTDRERIGGTGTRRVDFDKSTYAQSFDVVSTTEGKLGKHQVMEITLRAKKNVEVDYPRQKLWVDSTSKYPLKKQEFGESGKLMRTIYNLKWATAKAGDRVQWYPKERRIFDELVKGSQTTLLIKEVSNKQLPASQFTKAWFESKSR